MQNNFPTLFLYVADRTLNDKYLNMIDSKNLYKRCLNHITKYKHIAIKKNLYLKK